jgi:hypothetical protein
LSYSYSSLIIAFYFHLFLNFSIIIQEKIDVLAKEIDALKSKYSESKKEEEK